MQIRTLSTEQCIDVLSAGHLAHLACVHDGRPYVVPIHVAYADSQLYAFSMPGQKIDWMRANPAVCLLVEHHGHGRGWKSVIVNGRYEELPDRIGSKIARDRAWSLLSRHGNWWEPGALKPSIPEPLPEEEHIFFRIHVDEMTGREAIDAA